MGLHEIVVQSDTRCFHQNTRAYTSPAVNQTVNKKKKRKKKNISLTGKKRNVHATALGQ
jgi:hypothetical protein